MAEVKDLEEASMVCCAITHSLIADMLWLDSTKVFLRIKLQTVAL